MIRFLLAFLFAGVCFGSDYPLVHRQLDGSFLEPLVGYDRVHLETGDFTDCTVSVFEAPPMTLYRCTPVGAYIVLEGSGGRFRIDFTNSLLQDGYYQGKRNHQMSLVGAVVGHPKIPDGEKVVFYFWYPTEDVSKIRGGHLTFKDLDLSKPFVVP